MIELPKIADAVADAVGEASAPTSRRLNAVKSQESGASAGALGPLPEAGLRRSSTTADRKPTTAPAGAAAGVAADDTRALLGTVETRVESVTLDAATGAS